ncbi:GH1 family beta-glucosidase [Amycolatopsis endophytica]|uniref:Beta-glucosidase n=1 Tax=Amycolatopsis endophytica TaxID=860233 RepID=A0A853BC06_9PSEU|nr:GH1 family beta-glucosidase [Amycolatopsis endophytica]NYI92292.1 beta-glucosidase [Amycolatopsis endophytica]
MSQPARFPEGFFWGTATASYQIEGAATEDGRGPSIWDTFSHTPGRIADGSNGDVACDHYHRYAEDVKLIADLGSTHYRFSFAWPRLQPRGEGQLHPAGVAFYDRLIDSLLDAGVQPWVTLYHWDLPQVLEDRGGWPERDTADRFADYAVRVHERFRDRVRFWTTLNEPYCSAFIGYAEGRHAPGRTEPEAALRAAHHLMLGHGKAVRAMREQGPDGQFGVTLNLYPVDAATDDPADLDAARRVDALQNRIFLDPILRGHYPTDLLDDVSVVTDASYVRDGDEATIAAPLDVLGVNYYTRHVVRAGSGPRVPGPDGKPSAFVASADVEKVSRGLPTTEMGWEIDPRGLRDVLVRLHQEYDPIPLFVTENGIACADAPGADGAVADPERVAYLDSHFRAAHSLIEQGVDLRGYFVWTLTDNFEWAWGFSRRFGLIYVDYETQQRIPKDSARYFAEVARTNSLP